MVYGTTRRGFKQGGINIQSVVPASNGIVSAQPTFAPEKVTDYEIGIKADYHLGSVDSRTNIALFTADFSGLHRATSFFNGQTPSNPIAHVAGLRAPGLEPEQVFAFSRQFNLNKTYASQNPNFTNITRVY